jgi:hypothetical protein
MNTKTFSILGVLAVAGLAAAYFATRSNTAGESGDTVAAAGAGSLLFPDLAARAGDVAQIVVKRAPMEFTVRKDGETWKAVDKAGYPVKPETVRGVLLGLSELKLDEPKTSRADQYSKLGVDDPIAPPPDAADKAVPQSALVTLKDAGGKEIAAIILGNTKYAGQGVVGTGASGVYVRRPGDKQSWLAAGVVDLPREPIAWLESKFADIKRDRIKSVVVTHPEGGTVTVSRDKQADPFAVKDIPTGRELKDPGVAESIAGTLTGLTFQDVAAASSLEPAAAPAGTEIKPGPNIELRTFDGLVIKATSVTKDAKAWWRLTASADDAIVNTLPPAAAAANPTTPDGSKPDAPAAPPTTLPVGTQEGIRKEIADLNAQWSPFAFAPADWKVRSVNTSLNDLLKDPAGPAAPATPGGGPVAPVQGAPAFPLGH